MPPEGAPNVLLIMTDDQGYGVSCTFGGVIPTPALDRVANAGLRYTQFHSTALCSTTRAALITGRNHHKVGFGVISELATGYPGYDSYIGPENATVGRILREHGYATSWFGKNHNTPGFQSALRRAFGADRDLIRTISGRGYQFTGQIIRTISARPDALPAAPTVVPISAATRTPTNLPEPVSELIGRDAELNEILDLSASHRLVTLTGAGGIGKTRLGFEVARHLLPRFADGVWAIELATLSDPELLPVTVATALGFELGSGMASPLSVANALRSKQIMLVLDNCEHVVDAAAHMAETLCYRRLRQSG